MDQVALVDNQIEDGQRLVELLAQSGFEVTAAAWVRESEEGQWFLYIASPVVDGEGAARTYRRVHTAMRQLSEPLWINTFEVKVIGAVDPITRDVLKAQGGRPSKSPVRYHGSRLGELPVEEAYIYPPLQPLTGSV